MKLSNFIAALAFFLVATAASAQAPNVTTGAGGTGQNWSTAATGSLPYFTGTGLFGLLAPGTNGYVLTLAGGVPTWAAASGSGTVTSVGLTMPSDFTVSGSPITSSGTLAVTAATQSANTVKAGPASGATAAPTYRALVAADLPVATTSAFGAVKPDGTTITISSGVISASGGGSSLPTDYISGCYLKYSSTTAIQITSGTAYIPASSATVTVTAAFTNSPTLSASSLYYVYLSSATTVVVSTTAPTSYQGTAWKNASNYRYIGSFYTDGSGAIVNFLRVGNHVHFRANVNASPLTTASSGSTTSVSVSSQVPSTARMVDLIALALGGNAVIYYGSSDGLSPSSGSGSIWQNLLFSSGTANAISATVPLNTTQQFQYYVNSGTVNLYLSGYWEDR